MTAQILIVEDDERLAAVVRDGLVHYGYHVTVVGDGATALAAVQQRPPALVVLDLLLPDLDGVEVCRRLRAHGGPPVIMLTARDAVADKIMGLESGADDYVTKPFVFDELAARVRAVLRRHAALTQTLLRVADLTLDAAGRRVWRGDRPVELTAREFDLLDCLMQHAGQVQVAVRDTGPGIAPEDLAHIFERFYRADRARSRHTGGAGLGLSIVRWIAEAHGGHVAVESAVGRGSTFTLVLPLSNQSLTVP